MVTEAMMKTLYLTLLPVAVLVWASVSSSQAVGSRPRPARASPEGARPDTTITWTSC